MNEVTEQTLEQIRFKKPANDREREEYAKQYAPLVYKIANQNKDKLPLTYEDILGYGFEGLTMAMNNYKEGGTQTFLQYAAYQIYYAITNGANNEGHIVKFSSYQQEKARKEGRSTYIFQRIIASTGPDDDVHFNIPEPSVNPVNVTVPVALAHLEQFVKEHFSERDADVFFQSFGLANREEVPRVQIAKQYKVTSASITYINQRIIKAIKSDEVVCEELKELLYGE